MWFRGHWYFTTKDDDYRLLNFQSGVAKEVRGAFQREGRLANAQDTHFRPINQDYPVFGFSVDLGSIYFASPKSTLFTLGLTQDEALEFGSETGNVTLKTLWTSYFSRETDAVSSSLQARKC